MSELEGMDGECSDLGNILPIAVHPLFTASNLTDEGSIEGMGICTCIMKFLISFLTFSAGLPVVPV